GNPLGVDALTADLVKSTLYPISVPADQLSQEPVAAPTTTPTATSAVQTVVGGTAAATPAQQVPTASLSTPTPLSTRIMVGAPEIDANGRLIGMVVNDTHGNHVIAPLPVLTRQIGAVTGRSGPLMTQWQQGITAYYANPPQFAAATAAFTALASAYHDFKGVAPFVSAAGSQSTTIPSLTATTGAGTPVVHPTQPAGPASRTRLLLLIAALVVAALLFALALLTLTRRRRRRESPMPVAPTVVAEEANLDLLPPDMTLDDVPALEMEQTVPLPAIGGRTTVPLDGQTTLQMPAAPAARPDLHRSRKGLALMPHAAGLTDPGIKRGSDPNQDNIIALEGFRNAGGRMQPFGLFIVADGMGGHMHGQEASKLAIEIVGKSVLQTLSTSQAIPESALLSLLRESVRKAGDELRERNLRDRADMGTTMAAALVVDDMAYVVNVGDSRAYLMSPETGLRQLTRDHSIVASLIASGVIRPEDIYTHPRRNQIYRSLGGESDGEDPDAFETPLQAGDKLLLCSDGLWEMVRDPQIELILRGAADPRQAAELLVREANANGGEDNISAVVVRLLEDVPSNAQPGVRVVAAPEGSVSVEHS
ncbi:MAG TPA: protein phosphatase 2C domain-containing protein, partial [Ktedonobacterales bacterium]|nr:protein phosphatase 2C domain-containing protein [Ktedonobacterales bacterium]